MLWSWFDVYYVPRGNLCKNASDHEKNELEQLAACQHRNAYPESQLTADVCNEVYSLPNKNNKKLELIISMLKITSALQVIALIGQRYIVQ